jgi:hypothetical protein
MGAVFTSCPNTNRPIATGIDIDGETFASLLPFVGQVNCPHCKIVHQWTKAKAWIEEIEGESK